MDSTATPCWYCDSIAVSRVRLMSGRMADVCGEHRHDFVLEAGSVLPFEDHIAAYVAWRRDTGLPSMDPEDVKALVYISRTHEGYRFEKWEINA